MSHIAHTLCRYAPVACRSTGFTLLELLVAIAVFGLVAMLAYGGLASVLAAREETAAAAQRLHALQLTMLMLQRDLDQVVPRGIRDEYGDDRPALHGGTDWIEFTRGGWFNPTEQARSQLQRVAYTLRERALLRAYWQVLDRAQDSAPQQTPLLEQVRALRVRFLDARREWHETWPPLAQGAATAAAPLPLAVELTVELEQWGSITRLFRVR